VLVHLVMRIKRIEELVAWQLAKRLERQVFAFTDKAHVARDFEFCKQIRRSSSSAPSNMAEGFGRFWPGEFAHKLRIAIGELHETQDRLETVLENKYITDAEHLEVFDIADRSIGAAVKFAEYLDAAGPDWKKDYLARRREKYRAERRLKKASQSSDAGTENPNGNGEPQNQNPNENQNPNQNENPER